MSRSIQRIGSFLILFLIAASLVAMISVAAAEGPAQPAKAVRALADKAGDSKGLAFVDMAFLTGLVALASGAIRVAEASIKKIRGKEADGGMTPELAGELKNLCDLHKAVDNDGKLRVYASTGCVEQHRQIITVLEEQRGREEQQMRAIIKLSGVVEQLAQSTNDFRRIIEVLVSYKKPS